MININVFTDNQVFDIDGTIEEVGVELKLLCQCYMKRLIDENRTNSYKSAAEFLNKFIGICQKELEEEEYEYGD